jgi:aconitate hydratase
MTDVFDTRDFFSTRSGSHRFASLKKLETALGVSLARLPVSIRIVLESVLRNCDGVKVTPEHVKQLANWQPNTERTEEIPFTVARVILQDFTGVPLLADLAAMRSAAQKMGRDPKKIEPLVPVDMVVDHSIQVDAYGTRDALDLNMKIEFERNLERYQFLKWGMQAFDTFKVVPPGVGIVHQVNMEYLARGVMEQDGMAYPDTLVGTDSHTTMINGLGVVAWGVGGIEAEAAMLGQPVYFLTPDVVGVNLTGSVKPGVTATDVVLTITEMLRRAKVVGKFVEFFGDGAAAMAVTDRATIANMAPEYGATMGFFPVDEATCRRLHAARRLSTRSRHHQRRACSAPKAGTAYSQVVELISRAWNRAAPTSQVARTEGTEIGLRRDNGQGDCGRRLRQGGRTRPAPRPARLDPQAGRPRRRRQPGRTRPGPRVGRGNARQPPQPRPPDGRPGPRVR